MVMLISMPMSMHVPGFLPEPVPVPNHMSHLNEFSFTNLTDAVLYYHGLQYLGTFTCLHHSAVNITCICNFSQFCALHSHNYNTLPYRIT